MPEDLAMATLFFSVAYTLEGKGKAARDWNASFLEVDGLLPGGSPTSSAAAETQNWKPQVPATRVLFICTAGTFKSFGVVKGDGVSGMEARDV